MSRFLPVRPALLWASMLLVLSASLARADLMRADDRTDTRYLARIQVHSAAELEGILRRADELNSTRPLDPAEPVVFVLHGAEGKVFLRERYSQNKDLVDLAARLSALDVVDIRVCETWMGSQRIDAGQLQPFVHTVPYGPAEIERLRRDEEYVYF